MVCFKHETMKFDSIEIGMDSFTEKGFNSTIRTGLRISDHFDPRAGD